MSRVVAAPLAAALVTAALLAGCGPDGPVPTAQASGEHAYTICPPSGELPPEAINDRAVEVLDARLLSLGVETSSVGVGEACIDVTASTTSAAQDAAVRAVVLGTGVITLVAPPAGGQASVGSPPPDGSAPILSGTDLRSAAVAVEPTTGGPALRIVFSDAGSATLTSWSRLHPGAPTALVVDGVVVGLPGPSELPADDVTLSMGESPPVPLEAIVAMVNSGPLPPEWAQPRIPQG